MVRTTSDQQISLKDFSRILQGQIRVFKDYTLYNFPLCKITGYDLQLHLRYRIAFGIKKQKKDIVHAHVTREFYRFLHRG